MGTRPDSPTATAPSPAATSSCTRPTPPTRRLRGLAASSEPVPRALHPRDVLRQEHGGRTHTAGGGIESGRRHALRAQRDGRVEQALARADQAHVGAAQTLERAVEDALALGDRLVLAAVARHAEELACALRL